MPLDPTLPFASENQTKLEADYSDAFQAYRKNPTPQTRGSLLRAVDPVINTAIKSYGGPSTGSPTLKSKARGLAIRAFDSYVPERGTMKTHLLSQLRGLQRLSHQESQIIRLPEQVGLDRMRLDEAERELGADIGRDPSDQQLANYTGLSLKRIRHIRQAKAPTAVGSILAGGDEESPSAAPASAIPGEDRGALAWEDLVYHDLSEVDQLVFDHMLGRHGKRRKKPAQIASMLGVSQSAISQRASRIQKMLDERHTAGIF